MPYRDLYHTTNAPPSDDDPGAPWQQLYERFADIEPADALPEAPRHDFIGFPMLAISADGRWLALERYGMAVLIDTTTLAITGRWSIPSSSCRALAVANARVVATTTHGNFACDAGAEPRPIGGAREHRLALDGAGRYAATAGDRTVWLVDLDSGDPIYSLACGPVDRVELHPSGRHLMIAHRTRLAFYGPGGYAFDVANVLGATFSADGTRLAMVDRDVRNMLAVVEVIASDDRLVLGRRASIAAGMFGDETTLRFSPSGGRIVYQATGEVRVFDLATSTARIVGTTLSPADGFLADERRLALAEHERGRASIVHDVAGWLGKIVVLGDRVVGKTPLGFYGSLGDDAADDPSPYARPDIVRWALTADGDPPLDADGRRRLDEVVARRDTWHGYMRHFTADITVERLVELNRGLSYLTPAIVALAHSHVGDAPRFGPVQIGWAALDGAAKTIAALTADQRGALFQTMLVRLREAPA